MVERKQDLNASLLPESLRGIPNRTTASKVLKFRAPLITIDVGMNEHNQPELSCW